MIFTIIFLWFISGFIASFIHCFLYYRRNNKLLVRDFCFYLSLSLICGFISFAVSIVLYFEFIVKKYITQNENFQDWLNQSLIGGNNEFKSKD